MLGDSTIGRLAKGKAARVVGDPDQPHSFTYVPDIARALLAVGGADDAMGQAWNVPNAPDLTTREVLEMFAAEFRVEPKIQVLPTWMMSIVGLANGNVCEMKEMLYQWTWPFHVDSSKFTARFDVEATSLADGVAAAAPSHGAS